MRPLEKGGQRLCKVFVDRSWRRRRSRVSLWVLLRVLDHPLSGGQHHLRVALCAGHGLVSGNWRDIGGDPRVEDKLSQSLSLVSPDARAIAAKERAGLRAFHFALLREPPSQDLGIHALARIRPMRDRQVIEGEPIHCLRKTLRQTLGRLRPESFPIQKLFYGGAESFERRHDRSFGGIILLLSKCDQQRFNGGKI